MKITNENILLASLLGSNAIEQLPRFRAVENELAKHVTEPVSFLPLHNKASSLADGEHYNSVELWMTDKAKSETAQFFPFSFKSSTDTDWYLLPWEPRVSIEANTRITDRSISNSSRDHIGSIKERWAMDDYKITITGVLYGQKIRGSLAETYPRYHMEKLRDYLLANESIQVKCEPLQILGINRIAILAANFPFTKGESVQAYEILAKSDFPYNLEYKSNRNFTLDIGEISSELIKE